MSLFDRLVNDRFVKNGRSPIKDPRRKRWSEEYARWLAALGVLLTFLQNKDIIVLFPASWHPYIAGAAAALTIVAGAEFAEGHRDRKRWEAKLRRDAQQRSQPGRDTP